jgi:hypothetical protein
MKILIINGYSKTYAGTVAFEQYEMLVRKVGCFALHLCKCFLEFKDMVDTEIEFYIRTKDSVDDMLYEFDSSFVKREAAKQFDSIDIIFFEGDANLRPWSDTANKVNYLCRNNAI